MREFINSDFVGMAAVESVRLVDFDNAEVVPGIVNDTFFLIVSGTKPYLNMKVELSPLVYVRRPEYWGIEVIGYIPGGIGLPATAPYTTDALPLEGIRGTKGIEIIGANKTLRIDVPPDAGYNKANVEPCNENGDVTYRANQIHNQVLLIAEGTHRTAGYEVFFEQLPIDIFPPEFILNHRKPSGNAAQTVTDFTAETIFTAKGTIDELTIHDAQGARTVRVAQTHD